MGDEKIVILQKPEWLKIRPPTETFSEIKHLVKNHNLHTVCQESHCPNMSECWSGGTATFMVLGEFCTRGCKFCNIKSGYPKTPPDPLEPVNLAKAIKQMNLSYVVITSVDRDDLPDEGASHFAACITEIKKENPSIHVEVLIPDFKGNKLLIKKIIDSQPDVIAHNLETVERLQKTVRDHRAGYSQSLSVLNYVKEINPLIYTKSSLMLGLGEEEEEIIHTFKDLKKNNVDVVTLGQYLRPSDWHLPVKEYVHPNKFKEYENKARQLGFMYAAAGPFVRSSYKAAELFVKGKLEQQTLINKN